MSRKNLHPAPSSKPVKEQLKDMFSLHLSERRGALVFIILLVLLSSWVIYEQWLYVQPQADLDPIKIEMQEWIAQRKSIENIDTVKAEPFPFDPNSIGSSEWQKLGLSDRQADGILKYREKGGTFRVKKDLAKMYTISPEMYDRLEPFILLPDSATRSENRSFAQRNSDQKKYNAWNSDQPREQFKPIDRDDAPITPMDINSADTTELVTLPGIGPAFARGIVKYRNSLGGYVSLDQLAEVYVLRDKPDAVDRLKQILFIGTEVSKIPINTATAEELVRHPYINWKVANGLIAFRKHHGPFSSVEAIKGSVLINDELYDRIAPYLTVDPQP